MKIEAEIPDELVPWIAEVFTQTYPQATAGLSPSAAIKAVIVLWVKSTLMQYETERARAAGDSLVEKAQKSREAGMQKAKEKVELATAALDGPTSGTLEPTQEGVPDDI